MLGKMAIAMLTAFQDYEGENKQLFYEVVLSYAEILGHNIKEQFDVLLAPLLKLSEKLLAELPDKREGEGAEEKINQVGKWA